MNKYSEAIKADILNAANIIASCIQLGVIKRIDTTDDFTIEVNKDIFHDFTNGLVVVKDAEYSSKYYERLLVDFGSCLLCCTQDKREDADEKTE